MVDWHSEEVLLRNAATFTNFMHSLFGVYLWEFFNSVKFDWEILSGRRMFKWPMIFYLLCRYTMMMSLITMMIYMSESLSAANCVPLSQVSQVAGCVTIALASMNLALRTVALWRENLMVISTLIAAILGHWGLALFIGTLSRAHWNSDNNACEITNDRPLYIVGLYSYTMIFDFGVLCLTGYKLNFGRGPFQGSALVQLLTLDGLLYFLIAFLANAVAVVFSALNLNPIMSVIANVPATMIATIVSCRSFRRLNILANQDTELFMKPAIPFSTKGFRRESERLNDLRIQMDVVTQTINDIDEPAVPPPVKAAVSPRNE
ncbi:hypothetical protein Moror_4363 [Moniliophthora roreri MCA 2997]|uniref:Transmembrane protein n=2 Tax=Moniliophthora roreri TaxID=221103 RepID=V2YLI0_MONRO|nr:hypothetical protein Moror_4363 [Moniliophthora roreri MCA 2997]